MEREGSTRVKTHGRLFAPLAYTKTFAMAGAALLSVTLVPGLMLFFVRGRILYEWRLANEDGTTGYQTMLNWDLGAGVIINL